MTCGFVVVGVILPGCFGALKREHKDAQRSTDSALKAGTSADLGAFGRRNTTGAASDSGFRAEAGQVAAEPAGEFDL